VKVKGAAPAEPLSDELRTVLLYGPWKVGKTLRQIPPHDELRVLWEAHRPSLLAALPRGKTPWFLERDWFVRQIRGEPE